MRPWGEKLENWTADDIRQQPAEAFALFDADQNGYISVSELLFTTRRANKEQRKRGSLYGEMKLFHTLDKDGDAVITKQEFCDAIQNSFSTEELTALAGIATRRMQLTHGLRFVIQGTSIPATIPRWYDAWSVLPRRAETYVALVADSRVIARSKVALGTVTSWKPVCIPQPPSTLRFELYDSDCRLLGKSEYLDLSDTDRVVSFGPLVLLDRDGRHKTAATLGGTVSSVTLDDVLDSDKDAQQDCFPCVSSFSAMNALCAD